MCKNYLRKTGICIDSGNKEAFINALEARTHELTDAQKVRIKRIIGMF